MLETARIEASMAAVVCSSTLSADMLPLGQGIYVPADRHCKGPPKPRSPTTGTTSRRSASLRPRVR